ncbi:uncharacterized protein LOC120602730 [Pteropus medius]|uniref:uncharacterized protein LOC120602730 n=1 Tax=Pteropus vampyrus TaxID=132908 RepID=UPI00196B8DFE|nr:uncharacterized protein LOC120602730 [Pteropus giganteus]
MSLLAGAGATSGSHVWKPTPPGFPRRGRALKPTPSEQAAPCLLEHHRGLVGGASQVSYLPSSSRTPCSLFRSVRDPRGILPKPLGSFRASNETAVSVSAVSSLSPERGLHRGVRPRANPASRPPRLSMYNMARTERNETPSFQSQAARLALAASLPGTGKGPWARRAISSAPRGTRDIVAETIPTQGDLRTNPALASIIHKQTASWNVLKIHRLGLFVVTLSPAFKDTCQICAWQRHRETGRMGGGCGEQSSHGAASSRPRAPSSGPSALEAGVSTQRAVGRRWGL